MASHELVMLGIKSAVATGALAIIPASVFAQSNVQPEHASGPTGMGDIVVTAEKRSSSISRTPIAISARTQEALSDAGVANLLDLTSTVPNVQITTFSQSNAIQPSIRGIVSRDVSENGDPAVAVYVDGVYLPRTSGLGGSLFDLERVEILRGPQGTLYGRNATAGNMNIITASPAARFAANLGATIGNYGNLEIQGMVNLPITGTLGVRGAFQVAQNDGLFDTRGTTAKNYGRKDDRAGRITALWEPTDDFSWRVSADNYVSNGTQSLLIASLPDGRPADTVTDPAAPGGFRVVPSAYPVFDRPVASSPQPRNHIHNLQIRSRMRWRITPDATLSYVAGYQINKFNYASLFNGSVQTIGTSYGYLHNRNNFHEINLNLDSGRIRNIAGATYGYERTRALYNNPIFAFGVNAAFYAPATKQESYGFFDQITYSASDAIRLTAGVRYSHDNKDVGDRRQFACVLGSFVLLSNPSDCATPALAIVALPGKGSWSSINWKAGMEYDLDARTLAYASVATGYKAGGLNYSADSTLARFKPEHVTNYEVGVKTRTADAQASLNLAVFFQDYRDMQISRNEGVNFATRNAAGARIFGAELEGRWQISPAGRLEAFANYLNAKFSDYGANVDAYSGILYSSLKGNSLALAPKISVRIQYSHDFRLGNGGTLTPMVATYWQSHLYLREFNLPIDRVDAYSKSTLQISYHSPAKAWVMRAFVRNLEDRKIRVGAQTLPGFYLANYDAPRTYGLSAQLNF